MSGRQPPTQQLGVELECECGSRVRKEGGWVTGMGLGGPGLGRQEFDCNPLAIRTSEGFRKVPLEGVYRMSWAGTRLVRKPVELALERPGLN
jgi:hypothetical protein